MCLRLICAGKMGWVLTLYTQFLVQRLAWGWVQKEKQL